jgi:transposase
MQTTKGLQLLRDDRETLRGWLRHSTTPSGQTRRARILLLTTERVPVEATHWSTRLMARYAGVTQWQVRQFLAQIDRATPPKLALHLIVDNSSTHTTEAIRDFLAAHPRFHLHFTPTSASWLNAVETWFGQLERRALRRGVFTSVSELRDEIRRFIETHNMHSAKPFRWTKSASAILEAVERARTSLRQETSRTGH